MPRLPRVARLVHGEDLIDHLLPRGEAALVVVRTKAALQQFYRGVDIYDWERVGFISRGSTAKRIGFLFDTEEKGNGNGGHPYGTDLPADQKRALIEFMKTLQENLVRAAKSRGGSAFVALVLAVVLLMILAITFRGLWFVALPLAFIALVLAVRSGSGRSPAVVSYAALLLALIAFTGSALAAAADISIDRGYDVYENSDPADQPALR